MNEEQTTAKLDAQTREAIGEILCDYFDAVKAETPDKLMELVRRA